MGFSTLPDNLPTWSAWFDRTSSLMELACCFAITPHHDAAVGSVLGLVIKPERPSVERRSAIVQDDGGRRYHCEMLSGPNAPTHAK